MSGSGSTQTSKQPTNQTNNQQTSRHPNNNTNNKTTNQPNKTIKQTRTQPNNQPNNQTTPWAQNLHYVIYKLLFLLWNYHKIEKCYKNQWKKHIKSRNAIKTNVFGPLGPWECLLWGLRPLFMLAGSGSTTADGFM